jgi:hypothetical protein
MKKSTQKWRENNKDKYNEYMRVQMLKYRERNNERDNKNRMKRYYWNKVSKEFLNILISVQSEN